MDNPTMDDLTDEKMSELLTNSLNEQGYLLQEKCAEELSNQSSEMPWGVEVQEYPVSLRDQQTRIDIILRYKQISARTLLYAVVECKRANPRYVRWLFAPINEFSHRPTLSALGYQVVRDDSIIGRKAYLAKPTVMWPGFELTCDYVGTWLEVKESPKGDKGDIVVHTGTTKKQGIKAQANSQSIENTFAQVLKGVACLAMEQRDRMLQWKEESSAVFVPVVVTTAPIYVAEYKIRDIDLTTGTIANDRVSFRPRGLAEPIPWVLAQYSASQNLSPEPVPEAASTSSLRKLLRDSRTRSIFVVNSEHLVEFFCKLEL